MEDKIFKHPPFEIKRVFSQLSEVIDYGLTMLHIPRWWKETQGGGIRVAVIDTLACNHPDIVDGLLCQIDFTAKHSEDQYADHGTLVAGIIGARQNNMGLVGVAPKCSMYSLGVLDINGTGEMSHICNAIQWCIDNKMDIVNLSLGASPEPCEPLEEVTKAAADAGVILIAAAGNDSGSLNLDTVNIPARYDWVISVAAVDPRKTKASFSSTGPVNIAAPGVDIYSCAPPDKYLRASGTSFSAPIISGLAALILAKHKNKPDSKTPVRNVYDMLDHFKRISTDIGPDEFFGIGIPNGVPNGNFD